MKARELLVARIGVLFLAGGLLGGAQLLQGNAKAQVNLSIGLNINSPADFYGPLGSYGTWVDVSRYGHCWRPASIATGWQPYTNGHWEWTDCGWYWVSDEPWAWACYHYGYWSFDPAYGWVWIPGTEWSPAWVTWREAPDYVGWAPCGPGGVAVADSYFVFVDVHHFHDHLAPHELVFNDPRIVARSRPVGGFHREDHDFGGYRRPIAFNRGPGVDPIQRATGVRFDARPVKEVARQTRVPETVRRQPEHQRIDHPVATAPPVQQPRVAREQPRIYREAPAPQQPPPTGRQEQRVYHEVPNPQPNPAPVPHLNPPVVTPPREPGCPQVQTPRLAPTGERPQPPTSEHGRAEGQVHREEPGNAHTPPPAQQAPPAKRQQERDGQ
jgi:hypothetical protein